MPCEARSHRYVYRRTEDLVLGSIYHYFMTDIRDVFFLQQIPPNSVMYLVKDNTIVARNDNYYGGGSSTLIYEAPVTGRYTLILRSYNFFSPGYCDLWRGGWPRGDPPELLETDVLFWGGTRYVTWSPGQVFETTNSTGDPFLIFLFSDQVAGKAYFGSGIDDAGAGLNSRFVAPGGGTGTAFGTVILGSYSRSTEGECDFCQEDPSALAPPRERRETIHRSHEMQQFAAQLRDTKDTLEDLEPAERERKIAELRQKILPKDERRLQSMLPLEPIPDLRPTYEEYRRLSKELEQDPEGFLYSEQFRRLQELETRMLELETRMLAL
jgi:hypothetical protein